MAINERLIDTEVAAAGNGGGLPEAEQGLILHLDANDVDSYDGDGAEWVDISNHDVIVPLSDNDSNLKVHIDFADTSCYSGTGTTVNDLSSNNTTINTLSGSVEADFERGFLNVSENSNEGLTISDHADFDHTNGATYEGWVYLDPNGTSEETFLWRGQSNGQGLRIYWHASYGWFPRDFNASGSEIIDQNNIKTGTSGFGRGKWYHLALTLSSASAATYKFYVDGNLIGSYTASGGGQNSLSYDISLGKYIGGVPDLQGKIAQFRFYNKVLSASEIGQNYRHGRNNSYTELIPDTDLELHLDADSFPEKGEAGYSNTPSTWTALTGSNGTISGATFDSELGNYLDFDGVNDEVNWSTFPTAFESLTAITMELWVKFDTVSGTQYPIWLGRAASGKSVNIGLVGGKIQTWVGVNGYPSLFTPVANKWYHLAVTISGNTQAVYVDGEDYTNNSSTSGISMDSNASNVFLLGDYSGGTADFNGQIGQVRIYSSALTQDQIRQNFNFTKPNYPNGFDGTITGATFHPDGYFEFNGSSHFAYIDSVTSSSPVDFSKNNYSIAAWVNLDNVNTFNYVLSKYGTSDSVRSIIFGVNDDGTLRLLERSSSTNNQSSTGVLTSGTWHHIAVVRTFDKISFYINGSLDTEISSSFIPNDGGNQRIAIGKHEATTPLYFDGKMSDIKLYDKALTSSEVASQFAIKQFQIG